MVINHTYKQNVLQGNGGIAIFKFRVGYCEILEVLLGKGYHV